MVKSADPSPVRALFESRSWSTSPDVVALIVILTCFTVYKTPLLSLPLYWDEAWVYAPAIKVMSANGPSLLPGALDADLARGHPLLFHFTGSIWALVFGTSRASLHAFALTLSVALLVVIHFFCRRLGSPIAGIGTVLLLTFHEAFLAQSGLLLPEIMLALLLLLAMMFFVLRKPVGYVIAMSLALLTKEPALVLVVCFFTWECLVRPFLTANGNGRIDLRWLLLTVLTLLPAVLFFFTQRLLSGWFFYPEHIGFMDWDLRDIVYKFKFCYSTVFEDQGMEWLTYGFGLIAPWFWFKKRWWWSLLIVALNITAIKVLYGRWPLEQLPTVLVTLTCLAVLFFLLFVRNSYNETQSGTFAAIAFMFTVSYLMFCSVNFLTDRYLVCLLPFTVLGMLLMIEGPLRAYKEIGIAIVIVFVSVNMVLSIGKDGRVGDTKLSYVDAIDAQVRSIRFAEQQGLHDAGFFGSFMDKIYMTDPEAGYLSSGRAFSKVSEHFDGTQPFALYNSSSSGDALAERDHMGFTVLRRFAKGVAWSEIDSTHVPVPELK